MTRAELMAEVVATQAAFRAARDQVEATERRLAKAFSEADEDDQYWFVGEVMQMLGALVAETRAREVTILASLTAAVAGREGPVH
jgi:hypothetical protein